jgi:PD-(D/E)XK endonuclease
MEARTLTPDQKGAIAEAEIAAAAIRAGVPVLRPLSEGHRYDLVFDVGSTLIRVQCKWGRKLGQVIAVQIAGYRLTTKGHIRTLYGADEIDAVAVYCDELDRCYLLPAGLVAEKHMLHLRLGTPRNGQRAALNWAAQYELSGAIAQLEERLRGTQEVAGSSPASSTSEQTEGVVEVGAHEFRNRFGYWMECAAGGAEVRVHRRGKPHVRLMPGSS